jgi:GNAT superfamily N-acetyltransferase
MSRATVRLARPEDVDAILELMEGLAAYEKLTPPDADAKERLRRDLCADPERLYTLIAEVDGAPAGYAVAFNAYATFEGRVRFYLEDIFVLEEHRGTGAGFALFSAVAAEGARRGATALEWEVLTWNRPALDFYERVGGKHEEAWYTYRLDGERFAEVARAGG